MKSNLQTLSSFIWSVADILRGDFKQSQYGRIILPFTILRRLEAVLSENKLKVVKKSKSLSSMNEDAKEKILKKESGQAFYNTSELDLTNISTKDPLADIESYLNSFSKDVREIFSNFKFSEFLAELDKADLLFTVIQKFTDERIDLSPDKVTNYEMGLVFEDLIRRFAESSNETAGEHFTPRDMVRLTTSLVFCEDDEALTKSGVIRHIYDPTCGTGGFLSCGMEYLHELNENAQLIGFGQELNPESYAICKADMLIKGQDVANIKLGNTLSDDLLSDKKFDYLLSNPPFGVDWKKVQKSVTDEHKKMGTRGRFGAGLPRVSDGSLLFLMHLVSKMRESKSDQGSRIGIILNGSPLYTGGPGSGESEIRRYLIENDLIEAIIALPSDMFFNTGISTYIWVLTNKKNKNRQGKIQLINAQNYFSELKKSIGEKSKELTEEHIENIVKIFGQNKETIIQGDSAVPDLESKVFNCSDFGYRRIIVDKPLRLAIFPQNVEKVSQLKNDKNFIKLEQTLQDSIISTLECLKDKYLSKESFLKDFKSRLDDTSIKKSHLKLIVKNLGERSSEAEISMENGKPEADTELRDYEDVPLREDIIDFFNREVAQYSSESWINETKKDHSDEKVGVVGYEIPFNRYFFKYHTPRALNEIDSELGPLVSELKDLLKEIR